MSQIPLAIFCDLTPETKYLSYAGTQPSVPISIFVISVSDKLFFSAEPLTSRLITS